MGTFGIDLENLFFLSPDGEGGEPPETPQSDTGQEDVQDPEDGEEGTPDSEKTFSQADVDRIVKERLARAQKAAEEKAERERLEAERKYEELYNQEKAERERLETDLKQKEHDALRQKVSRDVGIPDAWNRLQGETEEELKADADALLEALPKPSAPDINSGPGNGGAPPAGGDKLGGLTPQEFAARFNLSPKAVEAYMNE